MRLALLPDQRDQVAREQLGLVLLHTRYGTLAATGFAVLLAWQLRDELPLWQLQTWLAAKLAVALARIGLAQSYGKRSRPEKV